MSSWSQRHLWKIVLFPTLAVILAGGVRFLYGYLHNQAGFDPFGQPIASQSAPAAVTRTPIGEAGLMTLAADDLARAGPDARHLRYLSLVHRHDDPTATEAQLDRDRRAVDALIASLAPPNATAVVVALDPARTVFRLDLRSLDWTEESWRELTRGYPYGLKYDAVTDRPLADAFTRVRGRTEERLPIVWADWWVAALVQPPHALPGGLGLTTKSPPPAVTAAADAHRHRAVDAATAARELRCTEDRVQALIDAEADLQSEFGLTPLLRVGGSVPRDVWESDRHTVSAFQELARRLKRGTPIVHR